MPPPTPTFRSALQRLQPLHPRIRLLPRRQPRYSSSSPQNDKKTPKTDDAIPVPNTVGPLPLWQRLGPVTTVVSAYGRAQKRRPYSTQFFSALFIYFAGDLSAQYIDSGDEGLEIDLARTGRSLIIGGVAAIPSYKWFIWLSHNFNYTSHTLSIATKIIVSQILFTPTFNSYFFGAHALLSTGSPSAALDRIMTAVPSSWYRSCQFWPPVTAFSFTFVPIEHRSVFAGVVAIGWQTYLGLLNRRAAEKAAEQVASEGKVDRVETVAAAQQKLEQS